MENAKKFFEEIAKTEEAKALFAATVKPETEEARVAAYIEIAKKLSVELTAEDIKAYFDSIAEAELCEIDDAELSQLVGGGDNAACADTFQHKENCWWNDGCDEVYNSYNGYVCSSKNYGDGTDMQKLTRDQTILYYTPLCHRAQVDYELKKRGIKP